MAGTMYLTDSEYQHIINLRKEKEHEEYKYLNLMQRILDEGVEKSDRTGVGTKSIFGTQLQFDLSQSFPVLTTKKVFWKGVVEELLWFVRGETDSKLLEQKGVKIWVGNTSREFLDKKGLNYPEGEIGPGYGFQWRHWGATYQNPLGTIMKKSLNDSNRGIDQLANLIHTLINNPNDRRLIVSAWNVAEIERMALPPCHMMYQFYVENGTLSCQWYQRSVDSFLGLPFNISSYALLTCLIAKIVGLNPGKLTFVGGDTHIYLNHINQVKEQLVRIPYKFPQLNIKKDIQTLEDIEALELADLELVGYQSHAPIKAEMAV